MFPETAVSLDALRALQLERLRSAVRHAYDNQAPYRAKCVVAGCIPTICGGWKISSAFPLPTRPTCARPIPVSYTHLTLPTILRV